MSIDIGRSQKVSRKVHAARAQAHRHELDKCQGCGKIMDVVDHRGVVMVTQFCERCETYDPETGTYLFDQW